MSDSELLLGVATQGALAEIAPGVLYVSSIGIGPVWLHGDDGNVLPRNHASETQAGLEVFEL